ncbi:MAG: cysteine hydrolase [Acidobacteriaceae bacterium]|nr:cysteine hydrolase [Acidobacteriaceae bacterium]
MTTVFFDVDTQLDFLYPAGALYVPGAEKLVPTLEKLTRYAAEHGFPMIATMDAHSEDDPEFQRWKPHCVVGTAGQQKVSGTRAPGQIVIEKQTVDCFSNPNLNPLVEQLKADRFVVYGVATEVCVQRAAFGLLKTGARVEVVSDAIKGIRAEDEQQMLERFRAAGGSTLKSSDVLA